MTTMTIGAVEKVILFGGGPAMLAFAEESIRLGLAPTVFAVPRHLEEAVDSDGNTLEQVLLQAGIPCHRASDVNGNPQLAALTADGKAMGIGLGEAYTFNRDTIEAFDGKLFDFMIIRLPQYRGGAHFTWQILRGHRIGCWNIQLINEEMVPGVYDSAPIIKTREFIIPQSARIPADFFEVYREEQLVLYREFVADIRAGKSFELAYLQENFSQYYPRLHTKSQGLIDWRWSGPEIERFICAFDNPYPGASTFLDGQRLFLKDCQLDASEGDFHPFMAGMIYRIHGDAVFVGVRGGGLIVRDIRDEAGTDVRPRLKVGQRLYTSSAQLEAAMLFSADYDAEGLKPAPAPVS